MTRRRYRISTLLLATALALVVTLSVKSQGAVPLFTERFPPVSGEGRPEVVSISDVVINMDALKTIPQSLSIDLPPGRIITATLLKAERRLGFDASGAPVLPNEELQFLWHGKTSAGGDVILTVVDGVLKGRVLGPEAGNFVIRRSLDGDKLVEVDVSQLPLETDDGGGMPTVVAKGPAPACSTLVTVKDRSSLGIVTDPDKTTIEVLVVFTEEARKDAGGDELDQDDDEIITSLVVAGADETSAIFSNSEIDAEVEVVHIARYEGFEPTGGARRDLFTLVDDPCIQALRREARADMVSVIVRNSEPYGKVQVCGQAVVQRPGCRDPGDDADALPGCDPGLAFQPFAYNFVAVDCLSADFVFGHELTHGLSAEHVPSPDGIPPELAFLPDSFGWNFLAQILDMMLRTLMSTDRDYERAPNVSNPDVFVFFSAYKTGKEGVADNAKTVRTTMVIVSLFGEEPIFLGDFESGDFSGWTIGDPASP